MASSDKPQTSKAWVAAKPFVNGGVSGMLATYVIQPVDIVKGCIQLGQGLALHVAKTMLKKEGFEAYYRGLSAGLLWQATYTVALAVALKQVATPEFKAYIQQVKKNARALCSALQRRGCKLVTGGTDNHLLLWDLRSYSLTGYRFEKVCELSHMTFNKNAVFGDSSTFVAGGVRIGTPAMTSRGCVEADFEMIAEFLLRALQIALGLQREHGKQNKDFHQKALCGLTTGAIGACFGNPADLALIKMQADNTLSLVERQNYKNVFHALYRITVDEGVLALWKGAGPTVVHAMALNMGMLASWLLQRWVFPPWGLPQMWWINALKVLQAELKVPHLKCWLEMHYACMSWLFHLANSQ
ncbi:hypothetical protein L7F22_002771 [Adiantum nelumboides]|nr:hypothetical protein [Adiantum nelumboides]